MAPAPVFGAAVVRMSEDDWEAACRDKYPEGRGDVRSWPSRRWGGMTAVTRAPKGDVVAAALMD
jgi:hypothetical protein